MNLRFDIAELETAIAGLLAAHPELAEDEVLRADMFEAETSLIEVLGRLVEKVAEAKAMASAIKARIDDLSARKARYERQEEAFRALIQQLMERADLAKLALPEATLSVSHRLPAPFVTNEEALPEDLCRFKRAPDMERVRAAVAAARTIGEPLPPGISMSNGKAVLTIRSR